MAVNLKWITPEADKMIAHMARVSNVNAKEDDPSEKLITYLIQHKHWSPFEMAGMCVEIETTRDIGRQILRHRSFHFQEFSQRYAFVDLDPTWSEARMQDTTNRQNSLPCEDVETQLWWEDTIEDLWDDVKAAYTAATRRGIAKEVARKLLPEGLTKTHMYMHGTIRDWIHYLQIRMGVETQKEHRDVAQAIAKILAENCPAVYTAAFRGV